MSSDVPVSHRSHGAGGDPGRERNPEIEVSKHAYVTARFLATLDSDRARLRAGAPTYF